MGGFLQMLVNTGRTMTGDVVIRWPTAGFGYYEDLVRRLEADPMVEAATPVIESFAAISLPGSEDSYILLRGIDPKGFARVTQYKDILWWKPLDAPLPKDRDERRDPRLSKDPGELRILTAAEEAGRTLEKFDPRTGAIHPAIAVGIEVTGLNERLRSGVYRPLTTLIPLPDGGIKQIDEFLPAHGELTITVLPHGADRNRAKPVSERFAVANEYQSGVFEIDSKTGVVKLETLQKMLNMEKAPKFEKLENPYRIVVDPITQEETVVDDSKVIGEIPARVTDIYIRGKGDLSHFGAAEALRKRCTAIYSQFAAAHDGEVPSEFRILIKTWEDLNRQMIGAVKTEQVLILVVFCFISIAALFLIFAIFWSMISEKTRDIGTLRAIGASRSGVAGVWLFYALAIGLVGASLGVMLSYLIVVNINPIHEWMGRALGIQIWDPKIYYFVKIPNQVNAEAAIFVFLIGVIASAIAALWPAIRAARMHPVQALRFE